MRIIAGSKRGMRLLSPPGRDTRPITDRVKESLFNILYNHGLPEGAAVADLFCGTGSMGLEALSRGAAWVTFIDKNRKVIEILKKNIARAGFERQCRPIAANILSVGAAPAAEHGLYDLVFVDPPYAMSRCAGEGSAIAGLMQLIDTQVNPDALIVLRTHQDALICDEYGLLTAVDTRQWGAMKVIFYRPKPHHKGHESHST